MQRNALARSNPPALDTCSESVQYLIGVNPEYLRYMGSCHDS